MRLQEISWSTLQIMYYNVTYDINNIRHIWLYYIVSNLCGLNTYMHIIYERICFVQFDANTLKREAALFAGVLGLGLLVGSSYRSCSDCNWWSFAVVCWWSFYVVIWIVLALARLLLQVWRWPRWWRYLAERVSLTRIRQQLHTQ